MAGTTIWNVIADFNTTLNLKVAVGATTATLDSATDDDNVALPTGTYFLTLDGGSVSSKEYIKCTLTGTALTAIQSVSRQGALTSGFARTHRKGSTVTITDFASIRKITDLLDGTTSNADMTFTDLSFTGTTTAGLKVKTLTTTQRNAITPANGQIVYDSTLGENYQYIAGSWSAVASGSVQPNASATVAGKVEIATSAESIAGTDTGGTGALLSVLPSDIKTNLFTATQAQASVYGADAGGDDTYVVAVVPVLAAYTTGQKLSFKPTTANTGACTIDFWPGVKNIKTIDGNDPQTGVIRANGVYTVVYDGTSFILQNEDFATTANKGIVEMATDAETITGTDTERAVTPANLTARFPYSETFKILTSDFTVVNTGTLTTITNLSGFSLESWKVYEFKGILQARPSGSGGTNGLDIDMVLSSSQNCWFQVWYSELAADTSKWIAFHGRGNFSWFTTQEVVSQVNDTNCLTIFNWRIITTSTCTVDFKIQMDESDSTGTVYTGSFIRFTKLTV